MMEQAKVMATGRYTLPALLRGNVGDCLNIREIAYGLGFLPGMFVQHCTIINDRLDYDGQLIHALVIKHAPSRNDRTLITRGREIINAALLRAYSGVNPNIGPIGHRPLVKLLPSILRSGKPIPNSN